MGTPTKTATKATKATTTRAAKAEAMKANAAGNATDTTNKGATDKGAANGKASITGRGGHRTRSKAIHLVRVDTLPTPLRNQARSANQYVAVLDEIVDTGTDGEPIGPWFQIASWSYPSGAANERRAFGAGKFKMPELEGGWKFQFESRTIGGDSSALYARLVYGTSD